MRPEENMLMEMRQTSREIEIKKQNKKKLQRPLNLSHFTLSHFGRYLKFSLALFERRLEDLEDTREFSMEQPVNAFLHLQAINLLGLSAPFERGA